MATARPSAGVSSSSSGAPNTYPAVTQTVPLTPSSNSTTSSDATSAFPTAAIVCIAIVGGVVFFFLLYKLYRYAHARHQRSLASAASNAGPDDGNVESYNHPMMAQKAGASSTTIPFPQPVLGFGHANDSYSSMAPLAQPRYPTSSSNFGSYSNRSSGTFAGASESQSPRFIPTGGARTDSFNSFPPPVSTPGVDSTKSSPVLGSGSADGRRSVSPFGLPVNTARGDSTMSTDQLRAQGSRSSLLLPNSHSSHQTSRSPQRMSKQPGQVPSGTSSRTSLALPANRTSRMSTGGGAPHNRLSRIEIVTPQPLAPPPSTVVATDRSTLAFSALSGIGQSGLAGSNGGAGEGDDVSSVGGHHWFSSTADIPVRSAGGSSSELDLGSHGSNSGNTSSVALDQAGLQHQRSVSPRLPAHLQQHHRGPSAASSAQSSSDFHNARSSNTSPVPALPTSSQYQHTQQSTPNGPQSPLDKLRAELEGEAKRRSHLPPAPASEASSPSADKGKQRAPANSMGEAIEAYRRGENVALPSSPTRRDP